MKKKADLYLEIIEYTKKYLPSQGPLEYFVHHNTLHAFEDLHFFEALSESGLMYTAETAKDIGWYQRNLKEERITKEDLLDVAQGHDSFKDLPPKYLDLVLGWTPGYEAQVEKTLKKTMFLQKFKWKNHEHNKKFQKIDTFWNYIKKPAKRRQLNDELTHLKSKFYSSYFDRGGAYWVAGDREEGLLSSFKNFVKYLPKRGLNKTLQESLKISDDFSSFEDSITHFLSLLSVPPELWAHFVFGVLYRFKGWSALVISLEENPIYNPYKTKTSYEEFILVSLIFEYAAFKLLKNQKMIEEFNYSLVSRSYKSEENSFAEFIFDSYLSGLTEEEYCGEVPKVYEAFSKINHHEIFKLWHEAYELYLVNNFISVLKEGDSLPQESDAQVSKKLQVVACVDDREESTRRHFETISDEIETFGYAGHYGLDMMFQGINKRFATPLCPVSASPDFHVWEELDEELTEGFKGIGRLKHFFIYHNRSSLMGYIGTFISIPYTFLFLVLEVLNSSKAQNLKTKIKNYFSRRIVTKINYEHSENRKLRGYKVEEMADIVYGLLVATNLKKEFAPLVLILGHGSKSINNPHEAAYNCGACSGGKGAPNARLFSIMANREDVRKIIASKGLVIPNETIFVGGYHCTSSDRISLFDTNLISNTDLKYLHRIIKKVEIYDAQERLRKFYNVPLNNAPSEMLEKAYERSHNLAQPRPEYGHNTNVLCVIGNRENSKKIFFDRRAFLVSYDQSDDKDGNILKEHLNVIIRVCAGINLEYYFSFVDNTVFGAGPKQVHNVISMMGVMSGYKSDLRLGLPWQMVEIHEPARIIIPIETTRKMFDMTLKSLNKGTRDLILNEWVIIIITEHDKSYLFKNGQYKEINLRKKPTEEIKGFEEIFLGKREILDFNRVL